MLTVVLCAALLGCAEKPDRLLFEEVTEVGLAIPGGDKVRLLAPAMGPGLPPAQQKKVVEKFADDFPEGLFVSKSVNSPYTLKLKQLGEGKMDRRGHILDVWFIAHGTLDQLEKGDGLDQLLGLARKGGKGRVFLTKEQLEARKIKPLAVEGVVERYSVLDTELIERVQLNGVVRTQKVKKGRSLTSTALLDARFAEDKEYPNRWRSITVKPGEAAVIGPPQPYSGFGGYVKATELDEPKGALFIELHFGYHEPYGWFEGYNVLAAKLPIAVRDNIVSLRRKLQSEKGGQ